MIFLCVIFFSTLFHPLRIKHMLGIVCNVVKQDRKKMKIAIPSLKMSKRNGHIKGIDKFILKPFK